MQKCSNYRQINFNSFKINFKHFFEKCKFRHQIKNSSQKLPKNKQLIYIQTRYFPEKKKYVWRCLMMRVSIIRCVPPGRRANQISGSRDRCLIDEPRIFVLFHFCFNFVPCDSDPRAGDPIRAPRPKRQLAFG